MRLSFVPLLMQAFVFLSIVPTQSADAPAPPYVAWTGQRDPRWASFDHLLGKGQPKAAARIAREILADAKAEERSEDWTRALVSLGRILREEEGPGAAAQLLSREPWPPDLMSQTVLNLVHAATLTGAIEEYDWLTNERLETDGEDNSEVKAWTLSRVVAEARKAGERAWAGREKLGELPVSALAEYIVPNTYPEGVRPTLRDTMSYLRARLLSDTRLWEPGADLPPLGVVLDGTGAHPLGQAAATLSDLARWHAERGNGNAALEARTELLRLLHKAYSSEEDRARLRAMLANDLDAARGLSWWSGAMATLAAMVQESDAPDALAQARELARRGAGDLAAGIGVGVCGIQRGSCASG